MIVLTCERREMSVYLRREVDTKESSLIRRSVYEFFCIGRMKISEYYRRICVVCVWCTLKATYEQSLFPFRDSEGKEEQASEHEIDCGSTGTLAFKDMGYFRPRSLVYFCKGIPGLAKRI